MSNEKPTASAEELADGSFEQIIGDLKKTVDVLESFSMFGSAKEVRITIEQLIADKKKNGEATEQLRKELAIAEEAARLGKLSIHEQFLATNKMAETIVENQRLTAEVERLEQELYQRYVSWTTELGNEVEPFEEWKASRGKGSGDQPNAG